MSTLGGPILRRAFLRHLLRHPWQTGLTLLGVALAVAVVVGIDLANASAERAFTLGVEAVAGRSTHEIAGGPDGVDERAYAALRRSGAPWARRSAPVLEGSVSLFDESQSQGQNGEDDRLAFGRRLRLLGIDPFAEAPFRDFGADAFEVDDGALGLLLTEPGAVGLSQDLATELAVVKGDSFEIATSTGRHPLRVVAVLQPGDDLARRAARDLLVADIGTAQELLGRVGRLDRIDLRLDAAEAMKVEAALAHLDHGRGLVLAARGARTGALDQMTRAFRLNLTALSLLALLVGVFLVYNTLTFSVVQRRPLLGRLRAMGVGRRELLALVLLEGAVLGLVASLAGLALGMLLAQGLLQLVVRTINDLYFALTVSSVETSPWSLAKGLLLGVGGSLLAALGPAREATTAPPRLVLQRSGIERRARAAVPWLAAGGAALLALAAGLLVLPSRSLWLAFGAVFAVVLGFAGLVPAATIGLSKLATPLLGRGVGILGTMAARGVAATLSRTGLAMAALTLAVATTLGVQVMILSFRETLVDWLETTLQADVYVAADLGRRGPSQLLDPRWDAAARSMDGVVSVISQRRIDARSPDGPVRVFATEVDRRGFEVYRFTGRSGRADRDQVFARFDAGEGILVSEPFAFHRSLAPGDRVELLTDSGPRSFEILAVYADYASDRGLITFPRVLFDRVFDAPGVHSLGLLLADGVAADPFAETLSERLRAFGPAADADPDDGSVEPRVVPNAEIKALSLDIFDRTFAITAVLRLLAVGVAFLGVLSALMALQLERARELGILRANGLTPRQVWGLVITQTGVMGAIAGLLALPLGATLAALLVHVINKRSFGWTLHLQIPPHALGQALALALVAALLAGLYPAWRMARSSPALALREE